MSRRLRWLIGTDRTRCNGGSLNGQRHRGPPGVYGAVLSGHRESLPVRRVRSTKRPEVTGDGTTRQLPITRNEGVPGSSPGVGFRLLCRAFFHARAAEVRPSGTKRVHLLTRSPLVKVSSCAAGPCRFAGISTLAAVGSLYPYVPARGRECPRFRAATSGVRSRQIPSPQIAMSQPLLLLVLVRLREEALLAKLLERLVDPVARLSDLVGIPPREAPRLDGPLEDLGPVA